MKTKINDKKPQLNSLLGISQRFPTEETCREFLEKIRWNGNVICQHCGHDKVYKYQNGKLYKCAKCRKQFTVKVGTIFEDSILPLQKWFFAMFLITAHKKGISSLQLSKDIQVTQKTAWFMLHRLRYAIKNKSFTAPLTNIVEADETYIGGKKHRGKTGRGSENKTPVFGLVERNGNIISMPVENTSKKELQNIINEKVNTEATIMTDEWLAYKGLNKKFNAHKVVNHGKKEYVRGDIHVNTIEGFWSLLKRGIVGIYHHVSPEHLQRYCDEFDYRYNTREYSDPERFLQSLAKISGRLTYQELIKN